MSLWLVLSMLMPLALTLLSVALYRLCRFLSMFFSLGNVVLRSGFILLCRQCFPDCGYSIHSIPWPFYSRQFHSMPIPSAFLSILYAALWRSAVPYINFILCHIPSAFLSILCAALWRSAVPYINFILCHIPLAFLSISYAALWRSAVPCINFFFHSCHIPLAFQSTLF